MEVKNIGRVLYGSHRHDAVVCAGGKTVGTFMYPEKRCAGYEALAHQLSVVGLMLDEIGKSITFIGNNEFDDTMLITTENTYVIHRDYDVLEIKKEKEDERISFPICAFLLAHSENAKNEFSEIWDFAHACLKEGVVDNVARICAYAYYDNKTLCKTAECVGLLSEYFDPAKFDNVIFSSTLEAPAVTVEEPKEENGEKKDGKSFLEKCISGEYVIPYEWDEESALQIPSLSELTYYVPTEAFENVVTESYSILKGVIEDKSETVVLNDMNTLNISLVGRPGTGKTLLVKMVAAALQIPFYPISLSATTENGTFEGEAKVSAEGKITFTETPFLKGFKGGGVVFLDEVNLCKANILAGCLNEALEQPYVVMENGCKPVHRHPLCLVFKAGNIGTEGTMAQNQAFTNRFHETYILDDSKDDDYIKVLANKGFNVMLCKWVFDQYKRLIKFLTDVDIGREDIAQALSLRTCVGCLKRIKHGATTEKALENLTSKIAEWDLELAQQALENLKAAPAYKGPLT